MNLWTCCYITGRWKKTSDGQGNNSLNGEGPLFVFSGNLSIFRRSENNVKIFIRLLHVILFPGKFLEVVVVGFQFMEFLLVFPDAFDIILPVDFKFMKLSHLPVPDDQVV